MTVKRGIVIDHRQISIHVVRVAKQRPQGLMNIYFSSELNDIDMTFIDIIDSSKLIERVPEEWHEKFLNLNQVEADFLNHKFNGTFDAISCISTLEHFGFDSPNLDETKKKGVFNRPDSPYELNSKR